MRNLKCNLQPCLTSVVAMSNYGALTDMLSKKSMHDAWLSVPSLTWKGGAHP